VRKKGGISGYLKKIEILKDEVILVFQESSRKEMRRPYEYFGLK